MSLQRAVALLALACLGSLQSCSSSEELTGRPGGDETGNGLSAKIVDRQGLPVIGSLVKIRPLTFLATDSSARPDPQQGIIDVRTDKDGRLSIDTLPRGTYHLESHDSIQGILATVTIDSQHQDLGVLQEQPLGVVVGRVALPDNAPGCIRIWGTQWIQRTDSTGAFTFRGVPAGNLRFIATTSSDSILGEAVVETRPAFPSHITLAPLAPDPRTWDHSARIEIDPNAAASALSEPLHGFPVLLRLDATNFPFAQANVDGSDLSVLDALGRPLPLEVAWWDARRQQGSVWIRTDTLRPNKQLSLTLKWGHANAFQGAVFDSGFGWSGVWHLASVRIGPGGRILTPDATGWGQDGTLHQAGLTNGILGRGVLFSGIHDRLILPSDGIDLGQRNYTWETWIKVDKGNVILMERSDGDTLWEAGEKRIQLGDRRYGLHGTGPGLVPSALSRVNSSFNFYANQVGEVVTSSWTHLALRQTRHSGDSVSVRWFVNGVPDSVESPRFLPERDDPLDSLRIGRRELSGNLAMEELRIARVARSDSWMRLSWETQRHGSTLVRILPP
jgi:hypothetical protein